jgi:hypothetical protein
MDRTKALEMDGLLRVDSSSSRGTATGISESSSSDSRPSTGRKTSLSNPSSERVLLQSEVSNDSLLRIITTESIKSADMIILASETGDLKAMKAILKANVDLTRCKGMNGYSCLHYAASRGHIAITHVLLQACFPVNLLNDADETALHIAVYNGNITIVEQLLDYGADIDARNRYGETPLFYAVRKNMPAVVRLLIQRGADVSMEDSIGEKAIDQTDSARIKAIFDATMPISPHSLTGASHLPISNLIPNHLLQEIFSYLLPREVAISAQVCGKWHRVSEAEEVWQHFGMRRWEFALRNVLGVSMAPADAFKRSQSSRSR